ncbi:amidohydrolase [Nocardia sp. NPDC051570]|uniref:amidohydrolase n=1 Tax=Nocardia sp. NPDC051570 TaxID=3364324 RepID=UPI00379E86E9
MTGMDIGTPDGKADRIFFNGPIVTMVEDQASAPEAVAIRGETIVFVGDLAEARSQWQGSGTWMHDLAGACLLPGFIDAHGHMGGVGLQALVANLLAAPDGSVGSVDDVVGKLSEWGQSDVGRRSQWIVGMGYDDALIGRHPTRQDLNRVSTERPVLAVHQSAHLGAVNDRALELLGYDHATPDPDGGHIGREDELEPYGTPDGVLEETAFNPAFDKAVAGLSPTDSAGLYAVGRHEYSRFGFTTAQEGGAARQLLDTLRVLQRTTGFQIDLAAYIKASELKTEADWDRLDIAANYYRGMRLAGVKLLLDGSPQGRTAWLTEPYLTPPPKQDSEYRGYRTVTDDVAKEQVYQAFRRDIHVIAHVNGDAAVDQFIMAVEAACRRLGEPDAAHRRPVAIHAQTARQDQIVDFARLGIIPSFFTMHTFYWGDWYRETVLGEERAQNISPTGWALAQGLRYTAHHDAPVALANSIAILSSQATRITRSGKVIGEHHRVSVPDALRSITTNAAYQYFEENRKGSIETGKQADLVILSVNPLALPEPQILESWDGVRILETIRRGETRFTAGGGAIAATTAKTANLATLVQHHC